MRIQTIEMKITLDDGTVVEGSIDAEYGSQRWGADLPHLAACVRPMEAMEDALREEGHFCDDDDDEAEE